MSRKTADPSPGVRARNGESSTVIARVVAILDLFARDRIAIGAADIAEALGISTASSYRYANDLLRAGLLARSAGRLRLGPKVIELEYLIRNFDPVLRSAEPAMHALAASTGHDVLLCNVYGETVVNVLHVSGRRPVALTYTKGLPMPRFRGAQARVILAFTDHRKLKRVYERALEDGQLARDARAIGKDWPAFSAALRAIQARGFCIAHAELDRGLTGIAAPVLGADGVVGSLVIVLDGVPGACKETALVKAVVESAADLSRRLAATGRATRQRAVRCASSPRISSRCASSAGGGRS